MEISKETQDRCTAIFFPLSNERATKVKSTRQRFVHYTSAEAAFNILKTKSVWMRQPACMNDYMEVEHGLQCLASAYNHTDLYFKKTLNEVFEGLSIEVEQSFDQLLHDNRRDLYLFCLSEHEDYEDEHGRLSMWRAYGKGNGVALVLNHESLFNNEGNTLKAYGMPVAYFQKIEFHSELTKIANNIKESTTFLKSLDRPYVKNCVLNAFRFAVLSTKHRGFAEEKEWRVIYSPNIEASKRLKHAIETINGVPQEIYSLPLVSVPGEESLDLKNLINRIIIGPTDYPAPIYKTFVKLLAEIGVENPRSKVVISDIPLRANRL